MCVPEDGGREDDEDDMEESPSVLRLFLSPSLFAHTREASRSILLVRELSDERAMSRALRVARSSDVWRLV